MDRSIPSSYLDYINYVNKWRQFPLCYDGLKPVERRVLVSAYKVAREKFVKSAQVDGYNIAHFHPHGTSYGTIVQLVKQGFLIGQGNFGCDIGIESCEAAAMRYTECKMSKETENMVFSLINYVPWDETEIPGEKEPIFLPTKYPICLLGNQFTQGIGAGYKTLIPCYKKEDLLKRLLWLLNIDKKEPIIKPVTDCNILSDNSTLKELLTTGKATIEFEGKVVIDEINYKISLHSWPQNRTFENIFNKLIKYFPNEEIGYHDLSKESATEIVFEITKVKNKSAIFNKLKEKINEVVKGSISFESIMIDENGKVKLYSIDEMLLFTYNNYKNINKFMLESEVIRYNELIDELKVLEQLKKPLLDLINKHKKSYQEYLDILSKDLNIQIDVIKHIISKYSINKLLTMSTDITNLLNDKNEISNNLQNLDKFILKIYKG